MSKEKLKQHNKVELDTDKLYYGFPVFLIGYKDEAYKYNYTTLSSSYTLGDMLVIGIYKFGHAIKQIKSAGCFTVNLPSEALMHEIEIGALNPGNDKLKLARKLTYTKSERIDAPIINECVLNIECEVVKVVELEEFGSYCNVFAKVKGRFIDSELQENGELKRELLNPILYLGDDKKRSYRYLDNEKNDFGDFSK